VTTIAFDLIELQGDDLRNHKLIERKQRLAKMLARAGNAIRFNEHLAHDRPCSNMPAGWALKAAQLAIPSGPSKVWLKSKSPLSEAVRREGEKD
jgi:hypothetical protein